MVDGFDQSLTVYDVVDSLMEQFLQIADAHSWDDVGETLRHLTMQEKCITVFIRMETEVTNGGLGHFFSDKSGLLAIPFVQCSIEIGSIEAANFMQSCFVGMPFLADALRELPITGFLKLSQAIKLLCRSQGSSGEVEKFANNLDEQLLDDCLWRSFAAGQMNSNSLISVLIPEEMFSQIGDLSEWENGSFDDREKLLKRYRRWISRYLFGYDSILMKELECCSDFLSFKEDEYDELKVALFRDLFVYVKRV